MRYLFIPLLAGTALVAGCATYPAPVRPEIGEEPVGVGGRPVRRAPQGEAFGQAGRSQSVLREEVDIR